MFSLGETKIRGAPGAYLTCGGISVAESAEFHWRSGRGRNLHRSIKSTAEQENPLSPLCLAHLLCTQQFRTHAHTCRDTREEKFVYYEHTKHQAVCRKVTHKGVWAVAILEFHFCRQLPTEIWLLIFLFSQTAKRLVFGSGLLFCKETGDIVVFRGRLMPDRFFHLVDPNVDTSIFPCHYFHPF